MSGAMDFCRVTQKRLMNIELEWNVVYLDLSTFLTPEASIN